MKLWPIKWQPSCLFFLCYLRLLLMMFPFTLYCRENSQWRRWRCFVGSWTSVRWRKTTRWSIPWLMLSAASWPLWRTLTQLWPPGPDCCWTPSRGRPCRWNNVFSNSVLIIGLKWGLLLLSFCTKILYMEIVIITSSFTVFFWGQFF